MNFGLTNWLNQKKKKKKSRNTIKCHDIYTIPLFLAMMGLGLVFYYFIFE